MIKNTSLIISACCFILSINLWSQNAESRIEQVENGLVLQKTFDPEEPVERANLTDKMRQYNIPGASVAIVEGGKIQWSKTYGFKEKDGSEPVTVETLFQSASIGKVITALAVLSLIQDGKLDLDEDVNLKLERWKVPENSKTAKQKVTLRHLLSHSAGLQDEYGFLGYGPQAEIPSLEQILRGESPSNARKKLSVEIVPGTEERYSGGGYLIIQTLIEDVTDSSFEDVVQERVFDPFKMKHSTYDYQPDVNMQKSVASGHLGKGKPLKKKKYNRYPEKAAAGPWTTAEDLARLILGIQKMKLENEWVREMLQPQINNKGLGVNLKGVDAPEAFWHAGQNLGYTALLYGLIERGSGAVVLVNTDGGERFMQEFMTSVADAYDWPVMRTEQSLPISSEMKSGLTGVYQNEDGSTKLTVESSENELTARSADSKKGYRLFRIDDNIFTFKDSQDYYRLTFEKSPNSASFNKLIYTESIGKTVELSKN